MKRFTPLIVLFFLCFFYLKAYGQVTQFPYLESFENQTFTEGTNVCFINNWFGNFVDGIRIFSENANVKNETCALGHGLLLKKEKMKNK